MKNIILALCSLSFLTSGLNAHNPAETAIDIFLKNCNTSYVRIEFTWSLRNALIDQYPFLKNERITEFDFFSCLESYVQDRLKIQINKEYKSLRNVNCLVGSHDHSMIYIFELETIRDEMTTIQVDSKLLSNIYKNSRSQIRINHEQSKLSCLSNSNNTMCNFDISKGNHVNKVVS